MSDSPWPKDLKKWQNEHDAKKELVSNGSLTSSELADYKRCKYNFHDGLRKAAEALDEVRTKRLFRDEYLTFDEFCQAEIGKSGRRANQLIASLHINNELIETTARIIENEEPGFSQLDIIPKEVYLNERITRELAKLPTPEARAIVLSAAMAVSPDGNPTVAVVRSATIVLKGTVFTDGTVDIGDGTNTIFAAAVTNETFERKKRQEAYINRPKPMEILEGVFVSRGDDPETAEYVTVHIPGLTDEQWDNLNTGEKLRFLLYTLQIGDGG